MKRKFLIIKKEPKENEHEKGKNEEEEEEDRKSDSGYGEERHPPPPKKARFSADAEQEGTVTSCASVTNSNLATLPYESSVKTEPREPPQNADDGTVADSECKVEVLPVPSCSGGIVPSLPAPILSPRMAEVSTTTYPDNHPVPVLASQCSHCAPTNSLCIEIPGELIGYFRRAPENGAFQSLLESVPNILVELEETEHLLIVRSFSSTAVGKVQMLADAFVENSRHRQKMLRKREDNSKWSFANFESNMFDANFLVEIEVSLAYTGLAFGKNRSNLAAARELHGIREITVDESQRAQGICKFKIYANTAEAADKARKMLEFTDRKLAVPANVIGQLIGKHSRNMNDIVNKSGVVRIFLEKTAVEDGPTRNFVLIGTPETIANAEMMLHFHLRHIRERDIFDEERDELERECAVEKASMVDAPASAGNRNYDNTAFGHWTSLVGVPSAGGTPALPLSSSGTRVNNNNRLPLPIFGPGNRRFRCSGTTAGFGGGGGGRRNEFPTMATNGSAGPRPLLHSMNFYQQPLVGMKGGDRSGGEWADSAAECETDSKPAYRASSRQQHCFSRRSNNNNQSYH